MAKIIQTSFKITEEYLYREVCTHGDKSAFIKDCIKYYLKGVASDFNPIKNNHLVKPFEVVDILQNL